MRNNANHVTPPREVSDRGRDGLGPTVLSDAIRGLAASGPPEGLKVAVQQLTHPDKNVRLAAAGMLSTYGADAKPFIPALRNAMSVETDEIVRTMATGLWAWCAAPEA